LDTIPVRLRTGDTLEVVKGILFFSSGNYKLIPRKNDDFDKTTSVRNTKGYSGEYFLSQNYPNPFNPITNINYAIPTEGNVTIKIFNILGQEVRLILNNEHHYAGDYTITFNAADLPSGIYFYLLQSGNFTSVMKMMLLK